MLSFLLLLLLYDNAHASSIQRLPGHIKLHHETVDVATSLPFHHADFRHPAKRGSHAGKSYFELMQDTQTEHSFLVHLSHQDDDSNRQSILQTLSNPPYELHVDLYVPHRTYIMHMTYPKATQVASIEGIEWVGLLKPVHKHAPDLFFNNTRPLELTVLLAKRGRELPLPKIASIVQSWVADFRKAHPGAFVLAEVTSHDRASFITTDLSTLHKLIEYLQDEPEVHYIQREYHFRTTNAWAKGIVQNGVESLADYLNETGILMWDYDLRGYNQVIGIADSGLDYRSCFFADSVGASPPAPNFATWRSSPTTAFLASSVNSTRRKVIQYVAFADNADDNDNLDGHGTHVSGSLVGYPVVDDVLGYRKVSGAQTHAKIAFFDIGPATGTSLSLPSSLNTGLLNWAYAAGARIHSNSWGADTNAYTSQAADIDNFMFLNKDMLVLVAAGNTGTCSTSLGTVGSPATAKNCLAVGASLNSANSWSSFTNDATYADFGPSNFDKDSMAYFSSMGPTADGRLKPDVSAPGYYMTSARNGQTGGATCDFANLDNNLRTLAGTSMATPTVASHMSMVREYFQQGFYPSGKRTPTNAFNCSAGLLKAIAIAGAVAMNGVKISFGQSVDGVTCSVQGKVALNTAPYFDQGYGRLELNSILFFASQQNRFLHIPSLNASAGASAFWEKSITAGATHTYKYCVYPNASVTTTVALVWIDPPSSVNAATNLVNNLDLKVTYNGATVMGNSQSNYFTAAGLSTSDTLNPVEVVTLAGNDGTSSLAMTVSVTATTISVGTSQQYSLVVSGYISAGACSTGPAIAPVFLAGASVNATTLPDRPANQTAPFTLPDPVISTSTVTTIIVIVAIVAAGVVVLGVGYILLFRKKPSKGVVLLR